MVKILSLGFIILSLSGLARAASITEDFNGADPYAVWAKNGSYLINQKQIVDVGGGQKALLIDVTLQTATYLYFSAPLAAPEMIPLVDLHVDGDVKVETLTGKGSVSLGGTYKLPSIYSGMSLNISPDISTVTPSWTHQSGAWAQDPVRLGFIPANLPTAQPSEVPLYVHLGVIIRVFGDPGTRIRFMVDHLSITGNNPTYASYSAANNPLYTAYLARVKADITAVAGAIQNFNLPTPHDPAAEPYLSSVKSEAQAILSSATLRGVPSKTEYDRLYYLKNSLTPLLTPVLVGAYTLHILNDPFGAQKVIPTDYPVLGGVPGTTLKLRAAPGEIESGSFVIKSSSQPLSNVKLTVTPPAGFPSDSLTVKWVKSWFQSGEHDIGIGPAFYTPELLVNDLDLVHVDTAAKKNYLRAAVAGVTGYYDISQTNDSGLPQGAVVLDAPTLTPAAIPAAWNQQVWITVRVPAGAAAGHHLGRIDIDAAGLTRKSMTVDVEVLPFVLAPSLVEHGLYYASVIAPDAASIDNMGTAGKSEKQVLLELQDMKAHGVLYPSTYRSLVPTNNYAVVHRTLQLMKQAGLPTDKIRTLGTATINFFDPLPPATLQSRLAALANDVKTWKSIAAQEGFGTVYIYGADERTGAQLTNQRPAWQLIRDLGAKVFVAASPVGTYSLVGNLLDFPILAHAAISQPAIDAWHAQGASVGMYANPQVGVEEPLLYRNNYGLALFTQGYDAAYDFAYHWKFGTGYGTVWNDFDSAQYSEHNFVYPTSDGLVGTIQWEGYREGVNDTRYVSTLLAKSPGETQDTLRTWVKSQLDSGQNLESIRGAAIARILSAPGNSAAPVLSAVQAVVIDSTTASIRWNTNKDCDSRVEFSSAPTAGVSVVRDSRWLRAHALRLGALQPEASYTFRVFSTDLLGQETSSQPLVFNTRSVPPAAPKGLKIP